MPGVRAQILRTVKGQRSPGSTRMLPPLKNFPVPQTEPRHALHPPFLCQMPSCHPSVFNEAEIQAQVDKRLRGVAQVQGSGRYNSQRGGSETVWVKRQVAWPQNHMRGGISKSRVSFDSLNVFQFVSGFAGNIRGEGDVDTKKLDV